MDQHMHTIKPFGLRMPQELKDWAAARAKSAKRSLNSELLLILEETKLAEERKEAF